MTHKKPWSIFDPLPDKPFPDLGTEPSEEMKSGKLSPRIHKEVFGDLNDEGLFDDIFGVPKKKYVDITLKNKKKR
jgi:hypothetical protein